MVVSFQDLFENKSTKNLQSQIKEMQRRLKSEIVTENDCCITLTFVDLVSVTTAAKAKAIQTAAILRCIVSS